MLDKLYHGTKAHGLTKLLAQEAGHGKKFLYATTDLVFAAIFINRPGGSLLQKWGKDKETQKSYLVERVEGIIDKNYKNTEGSIYVLPKVGFHQEENMRRDEWVSSESVDVMEEIAISDVKSYLLELEKDGRLDIIYYQDRLNKFPLIDDQLIEDGVNLVKKYKDSGIETIKKFRPDILEAVLQKLRY